jgi:soluble lytic murein transglycosylase-like protein
MKFRHYTIILPLAVCAIFTGLGRPLPAAAEIYQFVSADGVLHFTNVPTDPRYQRMEPAPGSADIQQTIRHSASRYHVDPNLVKAVIKVESDFNPSAVSKAGAIGLMQLMPATADTLKVRDPFNPHENIMGGVRHLSHLLGEFGGDLTLALAAYHAGATRVKRYGDVPPIAETHRYIKKVLAAYSRYMGR